jgi:hypothetical protein
MPSIETQLGAAIQKLKRALTPEQLEEVLHVIKLCIAADGRRPTQTPPTPDGSQDE